MREYEVRIDATVYVHADSPDDAQNRVNAALNDLDLEIAVNDAKVETAS